MEGRNVQLLSEYGILPSGGQDSALPPTKRKRARDPHESWPRKKAFHDEILFPSLRPGVRKGVSLARRNNSLFGPTPDQGCHHPRSVRRHPESECTGTRLLLQDKARESRQAVVGEAVEHAAGRFEATVPESGCLHRQISREAAGAAVDSADGHSTSQQDNPSDDTLPGEIIPSVEAPVKPEVVEASIEDFPTSSSADQVVHSAPDTPDITAQAISQQLQALHSAVSAIQEDNQRLREENRQLSIKLENLTNRFNERESRVEHAINVLQGRTRCEYGG